MKIIITVLFNEDNLTVLFNEDYKWTGVLCEKVGAETIGGTVAGS